MVDTYYSHLRKVTRGMVKFGGRKYHNESLKEYEGQMVDVDSTQLNDVTKRRIYTLKGKFICEATMKVNGGTNG